ncbi:expressed unknown protein [Ectocarpus siliculosus]|uniref:Uncharacterized protein n=1 Tax=Ectocarpus siliculosus TaxID=2880 RepID=D7FKB8_ECTSI|nr:expressed unknown protein [Ectocarpus siliculosus]|eukprot:CBJ29321.1 expressed unknown protein [Ectocarpus siliculosus]
MAPKNSPPSKGKEAVKDLKASASPIAVAQAQVAHTFGKLTDVIQELQDAVEKERVAVDTDKLNKPGHGAHNFGQPILPLGDLKDRIDDTMTNTLYAFIDKFNQFPKTAGIPQLLLPRLFLECFNDVQEHYRQFIEPILFPNGSKTDPALLRDHLSNNYQELFLLTPSEKRDRTVQHILGNIGGHLRTQRTFADNGLNWVINETGLDALVHKYREIMVHVRLQPTPATFSTDCGMFLEVVKKKPWSLTVQQPTAAGVQPFDPKRHSSSVDAMGTSEGDLCVVVFPAMEVDGVRCNISYTLSLDRHQAELVATPGQNPTRQPPNQVDVHIMPVRDQLDVWNSTPESLKTVEQLRKTVAVIGKMLAALEHLPGYDARNAFSDLGQDMDQARYSRWGARVRWFNVNRVHGADRLVDWEKQLSATP